MNLTFVCTAKASKTRTKWSSSKSSSFSIDISLINLFVTCSKIPESSIRALKTCFVWVTASAETVSNITLYRRQNMSVFFLENSNIVDSFLLWSHFFSNLVGLSGFIRSSAAFCTLSYSRLFASDISDKSGSWSSSKCLKIATRIRESHKVTETHQKCTLRGQFSCLCSICRTKEQRPGQNCERYEIYDQRPSFVTGHVGLYYGPCSSNQVFCRPKMIEILDPGTF